MFKEEIKIGNEIWRHIDNFGSLGIYGKVNENGELGNKRILLTPKGRIFFEYEIN